MNRFQILWTALLSIAVTLATLLIGHTVSPRLPPVVVEPPPKVQGVTANSIPIINPNWNINDWYIDGTAGSDTANSGTTSGSPLKTWHRLYDQILGCAYAQGACPRYTQGGTFTIHINGSLAASDVIYGNFAVENGSVLVIKSDNNGTSLGSGTLSGVVNINRNIGRPTSYSISGIAGTLNGGTMILNTTRNTKAWIASILSGVSAPWQSSPFQPPMTVPFTSTTAHPVTQLSSANGDSVQAWQPNSVSIGKITFSPSSFGDGSGAVNNPMYIYNLTVLPQGGAPLGLQNTATTDGLISFVECSIQTNLVYGGLGLSSRSGIYNSYTASLFGGKLSSNDVQGSDDFVVYGGAIGPSDIVGGGVTTTHLDGDLYMMGSTRISIGASVGAMYLSPGTDIQFEGNLFMNSVDYTNKVIYSFADGGAGNGFPTFCMLDSYIAFTSNSTWAASLINLSPELNQIHLGQPSFCSTLFSGSTGTLNCNLGPLTTALFDNEGGVCNTYGACYAGPGTGP